VNGGDADADSLGELECRRDRRAAVVSPIDAENDVLLGESDEIAAPGDHRACRMCGHRRRGRPDE
jgi:hypothetical protein